MGLSKSNLSRSERTSPGRLPAAGEAPIPAANANANGEARRDSQNPQPHTTAGVSTAGRSRSSHDLRAEYELEREKDREVFHGGPDGSQTPAGGQVGIEGPDGALYCVGCLWCDGDYDHWRRYQGRAA